jgi:hypothetical protein
LDIMQAKFSNSDWSGNSSGPAHCISVNIKYEYGGDNEPKVFVSLPWVY